MHTICFSCLLTDHKNHDIVMLDDLKEKYAKQAEQQKLANNVNNQVINNPYLNQVQQIHQNQQQVQVKTAEESREKLLQRKKDCYLFLRYILTTQRSYLKFLKDQDLPLRTSNKTTNENQNQNNRYNGGFRVDEIITVLD